MSWKMPWRDVQGRLTVMREAGTSSPAYLALLVWLSPVIVPGGERGCPRRNRLSLEVD